MSIRTRALLQFLGAGLLSVAVVYWFMHTQGMESHHGRGPAAFIALAAPGGFSLAGLVQFVSGVPFSELSDKWNALAGWQRGVLGFGIFVGCFVLLFGGFLLYASLYGG
jgi:hypothetical protein